MMPRASAFPVIALWPCWTFPRMRSLSFYPSGRLLCVGTGPFFASVGCAREIQCSCSCPCIPLSLRHFLLSSSLVITTVACSDPDGPSGNPATRLTVTPAESTFSLGRRVSFEATVYDTRDTVVTGRSDSLEQFRTCHCERLGLRRRHGSHRRPGNDRRDEWRPARGGTGTRDLDSAHGILRAQVLRHPQR
jgi:hypothetical protein